nr:hypothetical protein [Tanacetum cinerariifolium]
MTVGLAVCKNYLNDDIIYTTLKDRNLDQHETCRRLKMIRDVRENERCRRLKMIHDVRDHEVASKYSVDDVYTLLKECNMNPSEATQRLSYIDTFKVVKKKKDAQKSVIIGKSDNQWQGASRRNFHSSKVFNGSGGRNLSSG